LNVVPGTSSTRGLRSILPAERSGSIEGALVKAARALTARLDIDGVCRATLDAVEEVFGADAGWILLYDAAARQLRTICWRGRGSDAFRDLSISSSAGILGLAFSTRRVVFVPDVKNDVRWFDVARVHAADLQSVFAVPLVWNDEVFGVLGLDAPHFSADHPPVDADVACLEALAAQAAIAISNARLYNASEEDRRRLRALLQERQRLRRHVTHLEQQVKASGPFHEIIGDSPALRGVLEHAALVAPADTTILLLGETGSGKELLARFIHEHSTRARSAFVAVNCAALPEALVESELFGHERGAFTGAVARKAGKFEIAHGGTLFLDEIGDLPPEAQAKLLRVLQDQEVQRIGSTQPIRVDVRVVAATNQDLERSVRAHAFRPDLYYRLSVFPLRIPPLRERPEDIPVLAQYFVRHFAVKLRKSVAGLTPEALRRLQAYDWPGNVRELQNVIERAIILTRGAEVDADAIGIHSPPSAMPEPIAGPVTLADADRRAILDALETARWRVSGPGGAADFLNLKPTTLHAKMKKLGIHRPADHLPVGR
jgi:formate hydrogenlyase transcriptional activator